MSKLTEIVNKNLKRGLLLGGLFLGSLGLNAQITTAVDLAVQRTTDGHWPDSVKYVLTMIDDTSITYEGISHGDIHFSNVELAPTVTQEPIIQTKKPLSELIGAGQDYTLNFTSENQPKPVQIYDITGKLIKQIRPEWNPDTKIAKAYWDGKGNNGEKLNNGVYLIIGNGIIKKALEMNTGVFMGSVIASERSERSNPSNSTVIASRRRGNPYNSTDCHTRSSFAMTKKESKDTGEVSADYIIHVEPASHDPQEQFLPMDTILTFVEDSTENQFPLYVDGVPQTQDLVFKLRDGYTRNDLSGFIVRYRFSNGTNPVVEQDTTDANGIVHFDNVPADSTLWLEYGGDTTYYAMVGNKWNLPSKIIYLQDTIGKDTIKATLFPKALKIPARPGDENYGKTTRATSAEVGEMIGNDFVNTEEAMGRPIRFNLDTSWNATQIQDFLDVLDETDSLFYGEEQSPYVIVPNPIDTDFIDNNHQYYNHLTNYFPDTLGWNLRDGPATTFAKSMPFYEIIINPENHDTVNAIIAGKITLGPGAFADEAKELYGRRGGMGDVASRASFMNDSNDNGGVPTLKDRAIYHLKKINEKNKFFHRIDYYNLRNIKDTLQ